MYLKTEETVSKLSVSKFFEGQDLCVFGDEARWCLF